MVRVEVPQYAMWQRSLFWLGWLSLLIPGYFISYGFTLVGSLVLIMGTALLELLLIAIYTWTRFWFQETSFGHLVLWLVLGAAGIPLAALLGCVYAYAKLVLSM